VRPTRLLFAGKLPDIPKPDEISLPGADGDVPKSQGIPHLFIKRYASQALSIANSSVNQILYNNKFSIIRKQTGIFNNLSVKTGRFTGTSINDSIAVYSLVSI
jgi:hypothetical protein